MTDLQTDQIHQLFMQRCIVLARRGAGKVSPNPMVGAVIVVDGIILAEGWHEQYGGPHAEPMAINSLIEKYPESALLLKRATIYVSLEPCSHFGKTPPCADLIIKYQLAEVIIGCLDPSEKVAGKGVQKLLAAGINVSSGILNEECIYLNRRFFTSNRFKRPYIILKWAETENGFISPLPRQEIQITSAGSKMISHRWRTEEDCILIGKNTALIDDPSLTAREWTGRNPVRAVVDWDLTLPATLNIFKEDADTFIFNGLKTEKIRNLTYFQLETKAYLPQYILFQLYLMDLHSVIIEGGASLLNQFIAAGLWDEARIFSSNKNFLSGLPAPILHGKLLSTDKYGSDQLKLIQNCDYTLSS